MVDLSDFMYSHPGGTHLIEHNIGRDISKFFYGGYSFDGNITKPSDAGKNIKQKEKHAHTNIARMIMVKHIIGTLERESCNFNGLIDKG